MRGAQAIAPGPDGPLIFKHLDSQLQVKTQLKTPQMFAALLVLNIPALVGWPESGKITLMEALMGKFIAGNIFLLKDVAKWVYEIR